MREEDMEEVILLSDLLSKEALDLKLDVIFLSHFPEAVINLSNSRGR